MTIESGAGRHTDRRNGDGGANPRPRDWRSRWRPIRNRIRSLIRRHYVIASLATVAAGVAALHLARYLALAYLVRVNT